MNMYLALIMLFLLLLTCKSTSVYDATLSVDSSSGCPLISPVISSKQTSTCDCENSIISPKSEEPIMKEDKKCIEQQPLRLLTMVSRIPLPQPSNGTSECNEAMQPEVPTQQCASPPAELPSLSSCEGPVAPQKISIQKPCACVSVGPEPEPAPTVACGTKGRVFFRRGQTGKIVTKANHIAPIEKVSVVYEVATLAVPTTFTVVRTDYVPLTQTKTNVQTFAWTTVVVDEEPGCSIPPSISNLKPTISTCPSVNPSKTSSAFSSIKECQLATLCKKRKVKQAQATSALPIDGVDNDANFS